MMVERKLLKSDLKRLPSVSMLISSWGIRMNFAAGKKKQFVVVVGIVIRVERILEIVFQI